jgi:hypothetical protein
LAAAGSEQRQRRQHQDKVMNAFSHKELTFWGDMM